MNLRELQLMRDALGHCDSLLAELIADESDDFDSLLDRITITKRTIFDAFGEIAQERFRRTDFVKRAKAAVVAELALLLDGKIAPHLITIPNFIRVHETLLAFMLSRVGESIPGAWLRAVTGDQVHAERRVRQLRDLGFTISWRRETGDLKYLMTTPKQDLSFACLFWIQHKLKDATLDDEARRSLEQAALSLFQARAPVRASEERP